MSSTDQQDSQTHEITYYLAPGLDVIVNNVSGEDVEKMRKTLENPDAVISIQGRDTTKQQFIPVRNILAIHVREQG